jgi:hypothetical protein
MAISCDRVRDLACGFVLGALDPAEMSAVREHLEGCSKPHPELRELGGVLPYLGGSLEPVEPSARLRVAVLAAARADLATRRSGVPAPARAKPETTPVLTVVEPTRAARVISLASVRALRTRRTAVWFSRVAAAVAIVGLVGYAVVVQGDLSKYNTSMAHTNAVYHAMAQPGARSAVLIPQGANTGAGEAVLLPSGHVIVNLHGLAPTTGDEVYMVWFSADRGSSTKAGWFTVSDVGEGYLEMDDVPTWATLWLQVCREPNGDVTKPTGPTIVTGTISLWPTPAATPTA